MASAAWEGEEGGALATREEGNERQLKNFLIRGSTATDREQD